MQKDDWKTIARWSTLVYLPIALLVVLIFLLVSFERAKISRITPQSQEPVDLLRQ